MPRLAGQPMGHRHMQDEAGSAVGAAGGAASPIEFTDYGHQFHLYTSAAGAPLPEIVISQWAFNWSGLGPLWSVFLQMVAGLNAGSPVVRYRLREGGSAYVPDGKVILDTGEIQTNVPGYPANPTRHCYDSEAVADEGPCDLIKLTVEARSTDPEAPEFFSVTTAGVHVDLVAR